MMTEKTAYNLLCFLVMITTDSEKEFIRAYRQCVGKRNAGKSTLFYLRRNKEFDKP